MAFMVWRKVGTLRSYSDVAIAFPLLVRRGACVRVHIAQLPEGQKAGRSPTARFRRRRGQADVRPTAFRHRASFASDPSGGRIGGPKPARSALLLGDGRGEV